MLLRKFLNPIANTSKLVSLQAIDLEIIALLSNAYLLAFETLQTQMRIHGLKWERFCSSRLFEGETRDRGAVIARSNTFTRSLCWLRTKTVVDGSWVIQEGNDLWQRLPKRIFSLEIELSPQRQFDDTLAPVSEFFRVLHKQWADVCIEVVKFSTVGSLHPVGSHNFCRDIVAVNSSSSSSMSTHPDPVVFASVSQRPLDTDLTSPNPSTTDSHIFFTTDDTHIGVDQILMPTAVTPQDFTEPLAQLCALVNQISTERVQTRDDSEKLKDMLLLEIRSLEKRVTEMLVQQDSLYRDDIRKDVDETKAALSNALLEFHAQAQENYNNLSSQLGELVAYINRGGNDKTGEVGVAAAEHSLLRMIMEEDLVLAAETVGAVLQVEDSTELVDITEGQEELDTG
ncbi:hypothetical protein F511_35944 [Dorcoceras hygrometricum]|uniref:Uncharacterized protein n=1 Tax=Dorcoceras hygrometricum TaxID=472368 RepID=A0A2Z7AK44_9LAMI|nr:hypothetical protein F511_35944 [Dorcoceras hygrometricum]